MENTVIETTFICTQCKTEKELKKSGGTGYGTNDKGEKICYECCGKNDAEDLRNMKIGEKTVLYYDTDERIVCNWPGSLKIKAYFQQTGRHNIAGIRTNFWFTFEGNKYWGVTYGNSTQIAHVKRIKND